MKSIESARLRFRRFGQQDLNALHEFYCDPDVVRYTRQRLPVTPDKVVEKLAGLEVINLKFPDKGIWAVEEKSTGQVVGWFMLIPGASGDTEIGFMLTKKSWNQGYGKEAAKSLLDYGFQYLKLPKIIALTDIANIHSQKILIGLGFIEVLRKFNYDPVLKHDIETIEFVIENPLSKTKS